MYCLVLRQVSIVFLASMRLYERYNQSIYYIGPEFAEEKGRS